MQPLYKLLINLGHKDSLMSLAAAGYVGVDSGLVAGHRRDRKQCASCGG